MKKAERMMVRDSTSLRLPRGILRVLRYFVPASAPASVLVEEYLWRLLCKHIPELTEADVDTFMRDPLEFKKWLAKHYPDAYEVIF